MPVDASPRPRRFVVAVTGASGAIYAARTIAALLAEGCRLDLIFTEFGKRLMHDELGETARSEDLVAYLAGRYGEEVRAGTCEMHSNRDLGASIASGSCTTDGMVIVPCSMKTLAGVAHGLSRSLVERSADVMLKERRRLVVVPRETPMSLPQLRNMVLCAEAGAIVLPAMPAFYQLPRSLDDLADFIAGKILQAMGVEHRLTQAWTGQVAR